LAQFTIYNENGEILRIGSCPESMVDIQAQEGEFMLPVEATLDQHKVVDGQVVDKTQEEFNEYRIVQQSMRKPFVVGTETDKELNQIISNHFYGLVDVVQWRVENYALLRKAFYLSVDNFIDAQVKKKYKKKYGTDGDSQEEAYLDQCESVKLRFPKEYKHI